MRNDFFKPPFIYILCVYKNEKMDMSHILYFIIVKPMSLVFTQEQLEKSASGTGLAFILFTGLVSTF